MVDCGWVNKWVNGLKDTVQVARGKTESFTSGYLHKFLSTLIFTSCRWILSIYIFYLHKIYRGRRMEDEEDRQTIYKRFWLKVFNIHVDFFRSPNSG